MDDGRVPYGTGDLLPTLDEGEGESTITYQRCFLALSKCSSEPDGGKDVLDAIQSRMLVDRRIKGDNFSGYCQIWEGFLKQRASYSRQKLCS